MARFVLVLALALGGTLTICGPHRAHASSPAWHPFAARLGTNLIENGGFERGIASNDWGTENRIPGWICIGNGSGTVVTYSNSDAYPTPAGPPNHGRQFFAGGPNMTYGTQLLQDIDTHGLDSLADSGQLRFTLSGWLGGQADISNDAFVLAYFYNGGGGLLSTATIFLNSADDRGDVTKMVFRETKGSVPPLTRSIEIQLRTVAPSNGDYDHGYADNLSLVINKGSAGSKAYVAPLGSNLIENGGFERGPGSTNWDTFEPTPDWIDPNYLLQGTSEPPGAIVSTYTNPVGQTPPLGAPTHGANFLAGGPGVAQTSEEQDIDTSGLDKAVDAGKITFKLSGWLGGWEDQNDAATLVASFWGMRAHRIKYVQIGPVKAAARHSQTKLIYVAVSGTVPKKTRSLSLVLKSQATSGSYDDGYADDLSLVLTKK